MAHDVTAGVPASAASASAPASAGVGAPARPGNRRRGRAGRGGHWTAWAFLAPVVIYLIAFYAYPLYRNLDLSLRHYTVRSFVQGDAPFSGLDNYRDVFAEPAFGPALWHTLVFTFVSIAFQFAIGLALAVFFAQNFKLSATLRALFLVPWLLPLIVSASTWSWMLNSDTGIVNHALGVIGLDPVIPGEVHEAAAIDGANGWQRFWRVTFPLLRPVSAITLLLGLVYTLKVFDLIWIMTKGGPADASTTFATWSYRFSFGSLLPEFGPGAAVGNLLIVMALFFGLLYIRFQKRLNT
jgi:multiple sugar transport system permease protein